MKREEIKGIKIIFKDGDVEWYDPCDKIMIDNGECQYEIEVDKIESIKTYEMNNDK